ncbi:MAG: thiamine pyrophosphate-binding protein [Isosphaeraceae bacterium]|nr:thiamine pyrophosphate-binding protein [Isosphaeraceae bacterium]
MKLSDYVAQFIAEQGIGHVFMLPGGGAMHLNESLGRREDIQFVCTLHEQAAAIAAEAYSKVTNRLGAVMVTTGPGGTNAITGVVSAWLDSVPCLVVSGQVKRADLKRGSGVRILGVQEVDIVALVESVTKYAVTVEEPESIRYHLEKAVYLATTGRQGPVWLDIPLDVQAAEIDPGRLAGFSPISAAPDHDLAGRVRALLDLLERSERPVFLVGNGVRAAGAAEVLRNVLAVSRAPVLTTWLGMDLVDDGDPLFAGRPGAVAPRGANFALQNSDLLISVGARLDMALTGYSHENLAPRAAKVIVDVDEAEIRKLRTRVDLPIVADAGLFLRELERRLADRSMPARSEWIARCQDWKLRYPVVLPEHRREGDGVSTYALADVLSDALDDTDVVVSGSSGAAIEIFLLAFRVKSGQRVLHSRGLGSMGFGLPAAVGACLGSGRRTVCVEGDGSFQLNIQELATVRRLGLPVKMFVVNNDGFASIRASQRGYFGHLVAADSSSGLTLPNVRAVAAAYGIPSVLVNHQRDLMSQVRSVLDAPGPMLCDVSAPRDEERSPRISSRQLADGGMVSTPLEDLWPFLDRAEFAENMMGPTAEG